MLTSGTTGPPKRIDLSYRMLERVLGGAKHYESNTDQTPRLRTGVAVINAPLVHLGGLFRVLQCISDGRSFALLPRFSVDGWVDAVRRHRPATASLVPTALRMVLDADVDPAALASLRAVVSGTAPLDPDDADAFLDRYGVPVLVSYAATEFGGGVAGWTLADHRAHWSSKRGSVGRAHPGCELRVVDPGSGEVLASDQAGVLEVKAHHWTERLGAHDRSGTARRRRVPVDPRPRTRRSSVGASRCIPTTSAAPGTAPVGAGGSGGAPGGSPTGRGACRRDRATPGSSARHRRGADGLRRRRACRPTRCRR